LQHIATIRLITIKRALQANKVCKIFVQFHFLHTIVYTFMGFSLHKSQRKAHNTTSNGWIAPTGLSGGFLYLQKKNKLRFLVTLKNQTIRYHRPSLQRDCNGRGCDHLKWWVKPICYHNYPSPSKQVIKAMW